MTLTYLKIAALQTLMFKLKCFPHLCCCVCVSQSVQEARTVLTATSSVFAGTMPPVTE